jgi:hypothetical protein
MAILSFSFFSFNAFEAEFQAVMKRRLVRVAFTSFVLAPAIDVRRLFHGFALGAAIFARRCHARTNWVCTFLGFRSVHLFPPGFGSRGNDPYLHASGRGNMLLYSKEHIAILVAYPEGVLERDFLAGEPEIH